MVHLTKLCLKEKSNKAMFSLSKSLYTGVTFNPNLPLKVFDSTIRPIITYACEVWGHQYSKVLLKVNQIDKLPFESINNRFCKFVMGLPRQASNFGVKAELGRGLILSFVCSQVFRYWIRLVNMDHDRLIKEAYLSELNVTNKGGVSWVNFLIKILENTDLEYLWQRQGQGIMWHKNNIASFKMKVQNCITKIYHDHMFKSINCNSKLRSYVSFKNNYSLEKYINIYDVPLCWRKLYCSFRISCHNLEIERGRYVKPSIPPDKRYCRICKNGAETELHFILVCKEYCDLRDKLFKICTLFIDNFLNLHDDLKFTYLLNSTQDIIIKSVMEYIYTADKLLCTFLCSM